MGDGPSPPPNRGAWSELEQGFFSAAPPEVPVPPPAPMRFDDLESIPTPRVERRLRQRRALDIAPAERAELRPLIVRAGARCVPLFAWARARVPRLSAVARAKAGQSIRASLDAARREARALATRVSAAIPTDPSDRWMVASLAALFVLVGVSAVVIASRDGSRSTLPTTTMSQPRRTATPAVFIRETPAWPEPSPASEPRTLESSPSRSIAPAPALAAAPARAAAPTPARKVAVKRHRHHRKLARTHVAPVAQKKAARATVDSKSIAPTAPVRPTPAHPTLRGTFSR